MAQSRNLLILISDEHRRDAMGCAGHPEVRTPALDALAARGTRFTNAYTPSPICVPARAAIATGQPVHRTGHWDSATPYAGRPESWMHRLRDAGLHTASIGKLHFRATEDDNGFSEEILPMHVAGDGWTIGLLRRDPPEYEAAAELARDVGVGASSYTDYDRAITDTAEAWLTDRARADQRWAAFVSLVSPHYPLTAPPEFAALYDPGALAPPSGALPEHPELLRLARFWDYGRHFDAERAAGARAAYYALTSFMDHCVGRILAALATSGQADDTLILYVSDHGEMLGDHGFWTKQVMYEASAGVPMILAGPGVPAGQTRGTAASLLDIAPSALSFAGLDGGDLPGRPLQALASEPDDADRGVFSEYHDGGSTTGAFMLRWGRWKYIEYPGHPPQLFDLAADPGENRDLGSDPELASIRAEGAGRLRQVCDPEAVNARAFADQAARIEALGGEAAIRGGSTFNHTPVPGR